ncbi:TrkH family potassium uptake protein, partial [Burkholderia cenocepacia]
MFAGFVVLNLVGWALLALPISSTPEGSSSWIDALFTAVSAACVTGLTVVDTAAYWTPFGQAVILALIQL